MVNSYFYMPAKFLYHETVKNALIKDDWIITNDTPTIEWGKKDLFIDLGAEKLIAAEKQGQKIAVEIKSFVGLSEVANLEQALGQYILYYDILQRLEPERRLYLAIREETFSDIFEEPIGGILSENKRLNLIVFDSVKEAIVRWIP